MPLISVLMCIVMVQGWTSSTLKIERVDALSYIDDRYLYSCDVEALQATWHSSQVWEEKESWELNVAKSHLVVAGRFASTIEHQGEKLGVQPTLKALGTEMPPHCNAPVQLIQKRFLSAGTMAERIALLRLPVPLAQRLIQTIVMPKSVYQLVPRLPRVDLLKKLLASIKSALQMKHRRISWHALCACLWKGQHTDPTYAQLYMHVKNVTQARRTHEPVADLWSEMQNLPHRRPTKGPMGVWVEALRRLQVQENEDGDLIHPRLPPVSLLKAPWGKVKQFWSDCIRDALLTEASERRPHLSGLHEHTDIGVTLQILKVSAAPFPF